MPRFDINCIIEDCGKQDGFLRCFKFPKDDRLRAKWLQRLKLPANYKLHTGHRVCQRHFLPSCLNKNLLKRGSLPYLDPNNPDVDDEDEEEEEVKDNEYYRNLRTKEDIENNRIPERVEAKKPEVMRVILLKPELVSEDRVCLYCDTEFRYATRKKAYEKRITYLMRKLKEYEMKNLELKIKLKQLKKESIHPTENATEMSIAFARMIVGKSHCYTDLERNMVRTMQKTSTKSYNMMKEEFGFHLPTASSIYNWKLSRDAANEMVSSLKIEPVADFENSIGTWGSGVSEIDDNEVDTKPVKVEEEDVAEYEEDTEDVAMMEADQMYALLIEEDKTYTEPYTEEVEFIDTHSKEEYFDLSATDYET